MSRSRRVFSKEFKAKVVLEALKEKNTIEVLAKKYELLPNQISMWKSEAIKNISAVFNVEKAKEKSNEFPSEKLYARIGELTLENDFLKKSYFNLQKSKKKNDRF
jgi:transposase-like protein